MEQIADIVRRGKIPVIVGGTNQYIESLLFESAVTLLEPNSHSPDPTKAELAKHEDLPDSLHIDDTEIDSSSFSDPSISNDSLYKTLCKIDPQRAAKLHPNDRRRIERSIQIFETTGKPHTYWLDKQNTESSETKLNTRYNSLVIWLQCDTNILQQRLDSRVDQMVANGLLKELHELYSQQFLRTNLRSPDNPDSTTAEEETKGLFQAIGFKEFLPYLENARTQGTADNPTSTKLLSASITKLQQHTRWYANQQVSWIRNRFRQLLPTPIYCLSTTQYFEATNESKSAAWSDTLLTPAIALVSKFLASPAAHGDVDSVADSSCFVQTLQPKESARGEWKKFNCERCNRVLNGLNEWTAHTRSRAHRNRKNKSAKLCASLLSTKRVGGSTGDNS